MGDVIDIEAQPGDSASDIVVQLLGPDGLTVVEVDRESAGGSEAIRAFIVPAAGQWRVLVSEFFGDAATYRLTLRRAP
jgi:hypothetical protein